MARDVWAARSGADGAPFEELTNVVRQTRPGARNAEVALDFAQAPPLPQALTLAIEPSPDRVVAHAHLDIKLLLIVLQDSIRMQPPPGAPGGADMQGPAGGAGAARSGGGQRAPATAPPGANPGGYVLPIPEHHSSP